MTLVPTDLGVHEATQVLREMIAIADGIKPIAEALDVDRSVVAHWTQKGIPPDRITQVSALRTQFIGAPGRTQDPHYCINMDFSVKRLK